MCGTIPGTVQIKSNATISSNKIINTQTKTSDYIISSGSKTIKFAPGAYKVTIQSGSSGGGGGGARTGNGNAERGQDGVKGSDSFIKYGDISYVVSAPNAGIGGGAGNFQESGKKGGDANTCVNSLFVIAGEGGAGGSYGGSSIGGAGGEGGYCTKDINIHLTSLKTVSITIGNSGNGGAGGGGILYGGCGSDEWGVTSDCETYTMVGGLGGNNLEYNGQAGDGRYDADRFYAIASGGGGGSGPNGKVIITPLD